MVSAETNAGLIKPFSEQDVVEVIWGMEPDKAPGPDGFAIPFYRICRPIIKYDLLRMISSFLRKAKIGGCTNSTFLALIPKEVNPTSFDRFQPISPCNASYKIPAKLLANKLKPLLVSLIVPQQGGFVKRWHLVDNFIQVQEAIHSSFLRKEKGMIIKLYMKNAFDRVKLSFLYQFLLTFGFSLEFVSLIKACTEKDWIAPLINGRPTYFFQASRGLRQGCPLSPFLYILMVEALSRLLSAEMAVGTIPKIRAARGVEPINHVLFSDDSLLLGGDSLNIARSFNRILLKFCLVSGALINKDKSVVYGWNVDHLKMLQIAYSLGFRGYD